MRRNRIALPTFFELTTTSSDPNLAVTGGFPDETDDIPRDDTRRCSSIVTIEGAERDDNARVFSARFWSLSLTVASDAEAEVIDGRVRRPRELLLSVFPVERVEVLAEEEKRRSTSEGPDPGDSARVST